MVEATASLIKYLAFIVWNHTFDIFPWSLKTMQKAAVNSLKADRLCYKVLWETLKNTQRPNLDQTCDAFITRDHKNMRSFKENSTTTHSCQSVGPGNLALSNFNEVFFNNHLVIWITSQVLRANDIFKCPISSDQQFKTQKNIQFTITLNKEKQQTVTTRGGNKNWRAFFLL